jgi:uncharacterized protein (DUF952 family)
MASPSPSPAFVYRLLTRTEWNTALKLSHYPSTALDQQSGFIHLSTLEQSLETARLYFTDASDLLLMQLRLSALQPHLTWDAVPARNEAFPHLHQQHIPFTAITQITELNTSSARVLPMHLTSPVSSPSALPLLYKIASTSAYDAALSSGSYHGNSKDTADGFIHLSTAEQLSWVSGKFTGESQPLTLLTLRLDGEKPSQSVPGWRLLWESARSVRGREAELGFVNLFAHVYDTQAGIPAACIVKAEEIRRAEGGQSLLLPPV